MTDVLCRRLANSLIISVCVGMAAAQTRFEWHEFAGRTGLMLVPTRIPAVGSVVAFGGARDASLGPIMTDTWVHRDGVWTRSARRGVVPPERMAGALAFAGRGGDAGVVVFGGVTARGVPVAADTWRWTGNHWSLVRPSGTPPTSRRGHAMASDTNNDVAVLFGGFDGAFKDDTYLFDGSSWVAVQGGPRPPAREGHCMTYASALGKIVLFGGRSASAGLLSDTWEFDVTAQTWQQVASSLSPPARRDAAMSWYDSGVSSYVVLFGGSNGTVPMNDTWRYDGAGRWTQLFPSPVPPARMRHAMAWTLDGGRRPVLLVGGDNNFSVMRDGWKWDGSWSELPAAPVNRQSPLAFDSVRDRIVMFGGYRNGVSSNQTWELRGASWILHSPQRSPRSRHLHVLVYHEARQRAVLFGGYDESGSGQYLADTWEWDGANWAAGPSAGRPGMGSMAATYDASAGAILTFGGGGTSAPYTDETWRYDGTAWALLASGPPMARRDAAMAFDRRRNRTVLFGGQGSNNSSLQDTWEWDGASWTQRFPGAVPPARLEHLMVYDSLRERVVLFGGRTGPTTFFSDAWDWDGSDWRPIGVVSGPSPRAAPGMAFDSIRGAAVVFSGYGGNAINDVWELGPGFLPDNRAFGSGCPGSAGVPAVTAGSLPWVGEGWRVSIANLLLTGPAALMLGASRDLWLGTPLPIDLAWLGMAGCSLAVSIDVVVPFPVGRVITLPVPNDDALLGASLFVQGLVVDPPANSAGLVVSNALQGVCGGR